VGLSPRFLGGLGGMPRGTARYFAKPSYARRNARTASTRR
jgi:hypothetical protein